MAFNQSDYEKLLANSKNSFLSRNEKEKYETFKQLDPFPDVSDSLLNSIDILKYIVTTGMITPFDITKLGGVTYMCHFSGQYYYWDEKNERHNAILNDGEELILRSNSITYLEVKESFRVPDYLIFRYNLKVAHVYKGLLLGTGPIVDPGFVGKLYIPLHNLTSNEYLIRKGASLITLEFTKVGRNKNSWPKKVNKHNPEYNFDFSNFNHETKSIHPNRNFDDYLDRALRVNPLFKKNNDISSVGSSIPNEVEKAKSIAEISGKSAEKSEISAQNAAKSSAKAEKKVTWLITFGTIGAIVAVAAVLITIVSMFNDINARIDSIGAGHVDIIVGNQNVNDKKTQLENENEKLNERIFELEKVVKNIQQQSNDVDGGLKP